MQHGPAHQAYLNNLTERQQTDNIHAQFDPNDPSNAVRFSPPQEDRFMIPVLRAFWHHGLMAYQAMTDEPYR